MIINEEIYIFNEICQVVQIISNPFFEKGFQFYNKGKVYLN
jgi:hypothetical protein